MTKEDLKQAIEEMRELIEHYVKNKEGRSWLLLDNLKKAEKQWLDSFFDLMNKPVVKKPRAKKAKAKPAPEKPLSIGQAQEKEHGDRP
ncbi:hypothetical protein DESC_530005 [Desulfosarcina cetonica]|uniref:hypothetical protein n=1 Tax=Desulfosarcina cetonica TaxID=90730 RepID=UPI0006CF2E2B|nr:hypothetical protein [Desulfosarcina cetonica]VTR66891.1 hypothetical protein DESC_530005 [Desulfosarcina cetonica]